jgi:predicted nucleic-acid-binding Zn-ribbon protein
MDTLNPSVVYTVHGSVMSSIYKNNKIYASTNSGIVDIVDMKTNKIIKEIQLPKIKDFMGDMIDNHVTCVDVIGNNILIVAQASHGKNEVYIYKNSLKKIISVDKKLSINEARFTSKDKFIFVTLDSELYTYDLNHNKIISKLDVRDNDAEFNSKFSDFCFNDDKSKIALADESGAIKIVDLVQNKIIKILKGGNLDNVFKVQWKKNILITGGKDKKSIIYNLKNNSKKEINSDFFVYGVALSPNLKLGAYSMDAFNNVIIFKTDTLQKLYKLSGTKMTITSIEFLSDDEVIIASDSNKINYYKLK